MKSFASDNYAGVLPEVMEALARANDEHAISYGSDVLTGRVRNQFKEIFGADVDVLFVFNGTGANVLSIISATQTFNSVFCTEISHIYNDESSAPESITGCRFFPLPVNNEGKLEVETIRKRIIRKGDIHFAQPKLISLTQSTEYGTVYQPDQLRNIAALAKENDLYFHIDGSRFFNAAASLNCSLKEISTDVGVDILSLGGTKLGMMFGEAVVVFNKKLAEFIYYKQKQVMQLASKTRFIAAQYEALLTNNLWQNPASHANRMAKKLAEVLKKYSNIKITMPVEANVVFAILPHDWITSLQTAFPFYIWNEATNEVRLMCSFDTTDADIEGFEKHLQHLNQL
jgi:threonine aldolase